MLAWHRSTTADIGLRAVGLLLCAVAYLAISHLIALQPSLPRQAVDAECFVLAATGFLSATVGSAIACLGHHVFDQVEISARWGSGSAYLASTDEGSSKGVARSGGDGSCQFGDARLGRAAWEGLTTSHA